MIYAIDFDGTIVEDAFPEIGKLKPEAERFINEIRQRGDKWILWTMRAGLYLNVAEEFLYRHRLIPDAINDNLPEVKAKWPDNPNPRKIFADVYIDDRNAGGVKWPDLPAATIEQTIPEWCKVGQVVYNTEHKRFGRIVEISSDAGFLTVRCFGCDDRICAPCSQFHCHYSNWRKARVVPWTFRNAPDTHIRVKGINEHGYADVLSVDFDDEYDSDIDSMARFWSNRRQETFRADRYTDDFEQLNGMPCGTLEWWDGEKWLKEGEEGENDND